MALTSYPGITLTSAAAANTKGAYTQIVASTPYASSRCYVSLLNSSTQSMLFLIDLATGAAGAETVIVADLALQNGPDFISGGFCPITMDIPAGTRLSARVQAATAGSPSQAMALYLENRPLASVAAPVTYGTVAASSRGTQIDPGGTANTKGPYVQMTASTAARIDAVLMCSTKMQAGVSIPSFETWNVDIAIGASGSEVIVLADLRSCANNGQSMVYPTVSVLPCAIPSGSRVAVRAECSSSSAATRIITVTLIGMQEPATGGGVFPIFGGSVLR